MQELRLLMADAPSLTEQRARFATFAKAFAESSARVQALEAEVSKLKAKLIAAENALERAASRKGPSAPTQRPSTAK